MAKQYKVLVNTGKQESNKAVDVQQFSGDKGQPVRIKAQAGAKYQLVETARGKSLGPDYVKAKRVGKNLHILFEGENEASLIIEDYYGEMAPGYNGVIGQAENGNFYEYIPEDPRVPGLIPELAEGGRAVNVALGGAEVTPVGAALAVAAFPLLGALGLLGAAGAAAYIANQDSGNTGNNVSGKLSVQSDNIDGGDDNDSRTRDNTPTLTGTAPVGSSAVVNLNGVDYPVTVNPDGTWTFQQPTNLPDGTYYPTLKVTQNGVTTPYNLTPFTIDTVPPAVAITADAAALSPGQTTNLTFTLSEVVNDFTAEDVVVSGGTLSNFQRDPGNPLKYTATFTPSATGSSATIRVDSSKFTDAAGNINTDGPEADNSLTLATNATVTGALQPTAPNDSGKLGDNITNDNTPTLAGKVPVGSSAKILINGVEQQVTVAPDGSWTYTQPTGLPDGTYTPQLIVTPAGNSTPNAPVPLTPFTIDTVPPTIAVVADTNALTSGQTAALTFTLSEPVSDFSAADVAVTGGTLSNLQQSATDPKVWTATFSPSASGNSATISVASNRFSDAAGNANTDGAETNNTVTLATNVSTNGSLSPSSDNATGIPNDNKTNDNTPELSGKVPAGSSASIVINGQTYPVTVAPDGSWTYTQPTGLPDGTYTPQLIVTPAGSNTPSAPVPLTPFTIDTTPPTVAITGSTAPLNAGQSTVLTFTLSEASTDLTDADIQVVGGRLGTLQQSPSNPLVYTATFTAAAGSTTASVQVGNYRFSDAAGNLNADGADANNTWSTSLNGNTSPVPTPSGDTTPPTIVVERTNLGAALDANSKETIVFKLSEPSTTFSVGDVAVSGGSLSGFAPVPSSGSAASGYTQYTAVFTPDAASTGTATVAVASGQFTDNAGNANADTYVSPAPAGATYESNNQVSLFFDTRSTNPVDNDKPTIQVSIDKSSLAAGQTATLNFILSEASSNFTLADITVISGGGSVSNLQPVAGSNGAQYTATYTAGTSAGTVLIGVAEGVFTDPAGNANADTYKGSAAGTSAVAGSIAQTNNWVQLTNTGSADTTAPTIIVSRSGSGTVGATGETIYFTLSEASTNLLPTDVDVTGGTLSNWTQIGSAQYSATFTPTAGSNGTASIGVAAGKFTDAAGNQNLDTYSASADSISGHMVESNNLVTLAYDTRTTPPTPDTTAPTIAIRADQTTLLAGQNSKVTFTLSEASSDFTQADVSVSGGALSDWTQVNATTYSATFTPTAGSQGTGIVRVDSNRFSDAALNYNQDGAEANNEVDFITNYSNNTPTGDTTPPTIIVTRSNAGTTLAAGANETINFKLSEASLDFSAADVTVTGGTLSNFTPVPASGTPGTGYTDYTATFTPNANSSGTATIGVAAGKFTDNAGNQNLDTFNGASTSVTGQFVESDNQVSLSFDTIPADTTPPVIAITRKGAGTLTAGSSDQITFVLSETSTTFSLADVDVVGGTLSNFTPVLSSGDTTRGYTDYTATFTPSANSNGQQLARIGVQSGKFTDAAGNANLDTYVTGVTGTTVEANNVIDITYNTSLPDTTAPTIIVSRAAAGTVSTSETIYFTLTEASTNFTLSDVDVTGGTLGNFAPVASMGNAISGYTQFTATFTPSANASGVATIGVKSGTFTDAAGNLNPDTYLTPAPSGASTETNNQISLNFNTLLPDTTAPTIAVARKGSGVVTSTETITFTLSEPSTNFSLADVDVVGGTLTNFAPDTTTGSASTGYTGYTATFVPNSNSLGNASVSVASSKFTDAASNNNLDTYLPNVPGTIQEANNAVSFQINTDITAPTVAITRASGQTVQPFTGAEVINFNLSEASTDFTAADVVVTGGTLSNFSGSGTSYSATFTPTSNSSGTATISVANNTFSDAGGNANRDTGTNPAPTGAVFEANNLISAPFNTDSTAPTVIVSRTNGSSGTVTGTESITFTFSEAINPASFDASDIDAVGGAVSNLQPDPSSGSAATGYTRYSATYTPTANSSGSGSVGIKNAKFSDMSGNQNLDTYISPAPTGASTQADNQVAFQVNTSAPDTTAPTIAITRAGAGTVTGTEVIYFTLSEASSTFTSGDIDVSGGSLSGFAQSSTNPLVYSATFTPTANAFGSATISVAAGKFQDAAGNQNLDTYSGAPTPVTGQVVEANNQLTLAYNTDSTAPTIIVGRQGSGTVTGPVTVTFTLSEASSDFSLADIDTVGGTLSNFAGSGTNYSATFTPNANAVGTGSVGVASSKFSDAAGNFNLDTYLTGISGTTTEGNNTPGANIVVFQYATDTTAPTIAITSDRSTLIAGQTAQISFTLSEPSSDFVWNGSSGDLTVSGGTLSALVQSSVNPLLYTATFTPTPNSTGTASIGVIAGKFSDSAGNLNQDDYNLTGPENTNNLVSMSFNTVAADTTAPTVFVQSSASSLLAGQTSLITFTLSEASSNFTDTDVVVTGGSIGQFQQSNTNPLVYTAVFTPTANSTAPASVYVPSLAFSDAAGNNNVDGTDTDPANTNIVNITVNTVVPDNTPPTVQITSNKTTLALGETALLTLQFSEPVTDITTDDFTLSSGAISGLAAVPGTNNTVYQATYTPAANSTANSVITIGSNTFSDASGNFNTDGAESNNTVSMTTNTMPALALVNDTASVGEAGGVTNGTTGTALTSTTSGVTSLNVLANDTSATSVTGIAAGATNGTIGQSLAGQYGSLTMNANGSYTYTVENSNAMVQALRGSSNTLTEVFSYTASDGVSSKSANLTITITGANDAPVAVADTATAVEAGGIGNGSAGTNPTGNVLTNDTDVDSGDTKTVSAIAGGTLGSARAGQYGSLTLNADGSYSYAVDNANASVQALRTSANTLTDTFTYTMQDAAGATSTATLTVTVQGANDAPTVATTVSNKTGTQGTALTSFTGPTFADVDTVTNETSTVTAALANGQALSSIGLSYDASTNTFSGTPTTVGTYTVVVSSTDAGGLSAQTTFDIVVSAVPAPPLPTSLITQVRAEGAPLAAPTLTITDNQSAIVSNSGSTTFTFSFSQAVSGFTAGDVSFIDSLTGNAITPASFSGSGSTYTAVVAAPASGNGQILVRVNDGVADLASDPSIKATGNAWSQVYGPNSGGFGTSDGGIAIMGSAGKSIELTNGNSLYLGASFGTTTAAGNTFTLFDPNGKPIAVGAAPQVFTNYNNSTSGDLYTDAVALPNGEFAVFLSTSTGGRFTTFYANGQQKSVAPVSFSLATGTTVQHLDAAVTSDGHYVVIFSDNNAGKQAFYYKIINGTTGADIVAATQLSPTGSLTNITSPVGMADVVKLSDGKMVLIWEVPTGASGYMYLNADGTLASATTPTATSQLRGMDTVALDNGGFAQARNNNSTSVELNIFGADGSRGSTIIVETVSANTLVEAVAVTQLADGNIAVAYGHGSGGNTISVAIYTPGGSLVNTVAVANSSSFPMLTNSDCLDIVGTPDGGFYVTYITRDVWTWANSTQVNYGRVAVRQFDSAGAAMETTISTNGVVIPGGDGNDTLNALGANQVVIAGAGNDTVNVAGSGISSLGVGTYLSGGAGFDTLSLSGTGSTLELASPSVAANVKGFEVIQLGTAGSNTLNLNVSKASELALGSPTTLNQLFIRGDASDTLNLSPQYDNGVITGSWSAAAGTTTVGGVTYKTYTYSGDTSFSVLVESAITSVTTNLGMKGTDIISTLSAGTVVVGDVENAQQAAANDTTTDTTPMITGNLSTALTTGQTLKLYRTNITDGGTETLVATLTPSGANNAWTYQEATALASGKQYRYVARVSDGNQSADSNTYTINVAASGLSGGGGSGAGGSTSAAEVIAPTLTISDNQSAVAANNSVVKFTFNFSEAVTGFDATDVAVTNGTKGTFTMVSDAQYTLDVTMPTAATLASGTALVSVASGSYTDITNTAGIGATATQRFGGTSSSSYYDAGATTNTSYGFNGSTAKLSNGNYVLVSAGSQGGGQGNRITLFNSDGTVKSQASLASTIPGGDFFTQPVAMDNGEFAVFHRGGFTLFNAAGAVKQAATSFVTTTSNIELEAALLGNGHFAVIYANTTDGKVYYRTVQQDGSPGAVSETALSPTGFLSSPASTSYRYTAATLPNGKAMLFWENGNFGGYVVLNSDGTTASPPTSYTTSGADTYGAIRDMQAIALQSGGIALATYNYVPNLSADIKPSDSVRNVLLNLYSPDGSRGASIVVEIPHGAPQDQVSIAQLSNGNIVVAYIGNGYPTGPYSEAYVDNNNYFAMAKIYSADGTYLGWQQLASIPNSFAQEISVTALDDGAFALNLAQYVGTVSTPHQYIYKSTDTGGVLLGTSGNDTLGGTDGADTITGLGGADKIYAGAGNDTVELNADNITQLSTSGTGAVADGGSGNNMLKLSGSGITLDLTQATLGANVTNFQKFDISGSGANIIKINASDVLASNMAVGSATHAVQIDGDGNDIVNLSKLLDNGTSSGTWSTSSTTTLSGTTYNVYNHSADTTLQVLIDAQITQVTLS